MSRNETEEAVYAVYNLQVMTFYRTKSEKFVLLIERTFSIHLYVKLNDVIAKASLV